MILTVRLLSDCTLFHRKHTHLRRVIVCRPGNFSPRTPGEVQGSAGRSCPSALHSGELCSSDAIDHLLLLLLLLKRCIGRGIFRTAVDTLIGRLEIPRCLWVVQDGKSSNKWHVLVWQDSSPHHAVLHGRFRAELLFGFKMLTGKLHNG